MGIHNNTRPPKQPRYHDSFWPTILGTLGVVAVALVLSKLL